MRGKQEVGPLEGSIRKRVCEVDGVGGGKRGGVIRKGLALSKKKYV